MAYWETHRKRYANHRLMWYGSSNDEAFWADYWRETLTPQHYEAVSSLSLGDSILGAILQRELKKTDRIIEAGCGSADWVLRLLNNGYTQVEGIDSAQDVVQRVKQHLPGLPIRQDDALQISAHAATYDAYLSFGVVEHRIEGPEAFFTEAYRILKPGGIAIFTVPCVGIIRKMKAGFGMYADNAQGCPFFQYGFEAGEFSNLLETHGFTVQMRKYLSLDRLLLEEWKGYRRLSGYNRVRRLQRWFTAHAEGLDGHMLLVVAVRQA